MVIAMSDTSMSTAFDILLEIIEHQSADGQLMRRLVEVSRRQPGAIFLDPRAEIFDGFRKQQIGTPAGGTCCSLCSPRRY
jgi:hypothetical protein